MDGNDVWAKTEAEALKKSRSVSNYSENYGEYSLNDIKKSKWPKVMYDLHKKEFPDVDPDAKVFVGGLEILPSSMRLEIVDMSKAEAENDELMYMMTR